MLCWKPMHREPDPTNRSELGLERDCLEFFDWETGTRNYLRHTSKSPMLYHPKESACRYLRQRSAIKSGSLYYLNCYQVVKQFLAFFVNRQFFYARVIPTGHVCFLYRCTEETETFLR